MELKRLSDLESGYLIQSTNGKGESDLVQTYLRVIDDIEGSSIVSILQDFRDENVILSLEKFDEIIQICRDAGVRTLHVATVTSDLARAYTGVMFQDISDKYDMDLKVYYSQDIEIARTWLVSSIEARASM